MRMLLIFLFLFSTLHADWDQLFSEDEDPSLFHHVNVITGNLNLCLEDTVIEGAKPLSIFRTYSSSGALEGPELARDLKMERKGWIVQGGWNLFPHANLWIDLRTKVKNFRIYIAEPGGNLIPYAFDHKKSDHLLVYKPEKEFGQYSGSLSAKTNPGNNILELHTKDQTAVLLLPNGGSRIYEGMNFRHWDWHHWEGRKNQQRLQAYYRLVREILPSKHRISYYYDDHDNLIDVKMKNPEGTKIYSWMHIKPNKRNDPLELKITTSDGKTFQYHSMKFKEVEYLCGVSSNNRPEEGIAFIKGRKGIGARIRRMDLGRRFQFEANYYTPPNEKKEREWAEKPEKKQFETDKVKTLESPIGPHGEVMPLARFTYRKNETDARDSSNRLTRYRHQDGHLNCIEYFNERDELISILQFIWEKKRLKAKVMMNGHRHAYVSKVFEYDGAGNVVQETLWGSLTGDNPAPFNPNSNGSLINAEHYSKRYDYLPRFNVPTREEEDNGLTYVYTYKNDTDLLTAKFTSFHGKNLVREFFFYNDDNLLVAEVTDDGIATDPNDLNGVTERHIKRYEINEPSGLVHSLTETYLDLATRTEVLLRKTVYTYNAEHRVAEEKIHDSNGNYRYTIRTDYDAQGRVTLKTTPLGKENRYQYDSLGNLLFCKEVSHPRKDFRYDPAGRPSCVEESDQFGTIKKTFTSYDAQGNLRSQTDSKGNTTEQHYNAFGKCIQTRFPSALDEEGTPYPPVVHFSHDIQGNLSTTSVAGGGTTQTQYNALRKPVQITQADGTILYHRYCKDGTLAQTIYPDWTRVHYQHDMFERVTSKQVISGDGVLLSSETWTYNSFHLLSYTDPNGLTTRYTYDGAGRKIAEQAETQLITYAYDPLGFLEKTVEADVAHVQIHDIGGRVAEQWDECSNGRVENRMRFFYDGENKKYQAVRVTSQGEATDQFFYDRESRLARHIDPEENITEWIYTETETNAIGQRVLEKTKIDPLKRRTIETYDALNRVVAKTQKDAHGNTVSREEFFYDKSGNQARRITTVYQDHTAKNHHSVRWEYDPMGRVISEKEGSDKATCFVYDPKRKFIQRTLASGVTIDSFYDGIDRLLEMKSSDGTIHYKYAYDTGSSDPKEITDLIHHTSLFREYDSFGRLIKEINPYGLTFTWQYDENGRCTLYTLPDSSSIAYSYKAGHLHEVSRFSPQEECLYTHRYLDFDPNGHVLEEQLIHNIGTQHTHHDLLERPHHQHSPWLNQTIAYDPSSQVRQTKSSLFGEKTYEHDPLGQLIQDGADRYAFDSLGNPLDSSINQYNQIESGPTCSLKYDLNGNPYKKISSDGITTYTYDALDRLTSITYPDATKTLYFYDCFSRLISEQSNGNQTLFLYDQDHEVGAINAGAITQLKVIGLGLKGEIGGTVAIEIEGTAYAPLHDFLGNIVALISQDQTIAESYHMDAFGREQNQNNLNPWRFSSKRSIGGLVYFGLRFYDPSLGRWLTPDPSGFTDGPNLYVYVLNSPLNRLDLFGLNSDLLYPPELRMEVPITALIQAKSISVATVIPCKGKIADVSVDWVVSCGHWHKLNFTQEEFQTGIVNIADHFHELVPHEGRTIGLITVQNGICTRKGGLRENVQSVVNMVPEGTLTIGLYNQTEGFFPDVYRTFQERSGKDTPTVVNTRQFLIAVSEFLHKINPELLFYHIAHSEAGVIGVNAIQGMTYEQKERLQNQLLILGIGPAKPFPKAFGLQVKNIYSKQDFVTCWFAFWHRKNPEHNIKFVSARTKLKNRTGWLADHPHLGETYQGGQFKDIDRKRDRWGFYDGRTK